MPFKSQAQRRKFAQLLVEEKITPETYEEWNRETGGKHLPERVKRSKNTGRATKAAKGGKTRKSTKAKKSTKGRKTAKARRIKRKK